MKHCCKLNKKYSISKFYRDVESLDFRFPVSEIVRSTGLPKGNVSEVLNKKREPSENFMEKFYSAFGSDLEKVEPSTSRKPKIQDDPQKDGVLFVPIAAQAGYTQHFHETLFLSQLERVYIPGFPYRGDSYRIFEVAGDSMEPTLKEGYFIVGEKVESDHWHTIADFYIYAIVTEDRCMVKRLVKRNGDFVAISDNEFHPQFVLKAVEVKELWYVKRKIDWEMPPPKRFEVTV